jgi:hypothetical protein
MSVAAAVKKAIKATVDALTPGPTPKWDRLMQSRFELTAQETVDVHIADTEQSRLIALLTTYSGDRARLELRAARDRFSRNPTIENQRAMESAQMVYPQAMDAYRDLRAQAKAACKRHGGAVLRPLAGRIFARAVGQIEARLAELRAEESLVLERHALPYEPSPLSRALVEFRDQLKTAATVFDHNPTATLRAVLGVVTLV